MFTYVLKCDILLNVPSYLWWWERHLQEHQPQKTNTPNLRFAFHRGTGVKLNLLRLKTAISCDQVAVKHMDGHSNTTLGSIFWAFLASQNQDPDNYRLLLGLDLRVKV